MLSSSRVTFLEISCGRFLQVHIPYKKSGCGSSRGCGNMREFQVPFPTATLLLTRRPIRSKALTLIRVKKYYIKRFDGERFNPSLKSVLSSKLNSTGRGGYRNHVYFIVNFTYKSDLSLRRGFLDSTITSLPTAATGGDSSEAKRAGSILLVEVNPDHFFEHSVILSNFLEGFRGLISILCCGGALFCLNKEKGKVRSFPVAWKEFPICVFTRPAEVQLTDRGSNITEAMGASIIKTEETFRL
ncbi:unnamed protein product, partial [Nesidiocoris tenuis]